MSKSVTREFAFVSSLEVVPGIVAVFDELPANSIVKPEKPPVDQKRRVSAHSDI
jgi:hypothetical protein